ncbi:MAG: hypothetical protein V5A68_04675 [Candidatus Thermoplasmatota archaeon]
MKSEYNKDDIEIVTKIWKKGVHDELKCPKCNGDLVLIQLVPLTDSLEENFTPYDTVIECTTCDFLIHVESFSLLGSVKDFNAHQLEIWSWSPTGSRVLSKYEHLLDYNLLKELKESNELVEFLVVNKQAVQVIG